MNCEYAPAAALVNTGVSLAKYIRLNNPGNGCYLNSVFQALLSLTNARSSFYGKFNDHDCYKIFVPMEDLSTNIPVVETVEVFAYFKQKRVEQVYGTYEFTSDKQEDAHEFLLYVLDCFNKEDYPWFHDNCRFSCFETMNCSTCNRVHKLPENEFLILPARLPRTSYSSGSVRLQKLDFMIDNMDTTNSHCTVCCCNTQHNKRTMIANDLPNMLIVHILRFVRDGTKYKKLMHSVDCSGDISICGAAYKLRAIIRHVGESIEHGHYTTQVLDDSNSYLFDDAKEMKTVKLSARRSQVFDNMHEPYLIFLEKVV